LPKELIPLLKEPLLQFLLIGACIYGAYALFGAPDENASGRTIVIDEGRIGSLAAMWEQRWNRQPTKAELVGLVRAWLREDILYREALAMGLDADDHIIRRRLAQKLEFLTNDIAQMRQPDDAELEAYLTSNSQQFREPDRITFTHVFFSPDTRGEATLDDALNALRRLSSAGEPNADIAHEGDRFMLPSHFVRASALEIRRVLGSEFADSVLQMEPGQWHGPVRSGYGTHLVYVHAVDTAPPPELADVRDQVLNEWQRARAEEFDAEFLASLKSRYEIEIEAPRSFVEEVLRDDSDRQDVAIPDGVPAS